MTASNRGWVGKICNILKTVQDGYYGIPDRSVSVPMTLLTSDHEKLSFRRISIHTFVLYLTNNDQIRQGNPRGEERVGNGSGTLPTQGAGPRKRASVGCTLVVSTPSDVERPNLA